MKNESCDLCLVSASILSTAGIIAAFILQLCGKEKRAVYTVIAMLSMSTLVLVATVAIAVVEIIQRN